jgi:hypothetical protein
VGERGANITDLLCGRESSWGDSGEMEREEGGVMVRAGEGGVGARWVGGIGVGFIRPRVIVSVTILKYIWDRRC